MVNHTTTIADDQVLDRGGRSESQAFGSGPLADGEERRAIFNVLDSFRQYRRRTHLNTTHRRRQNYYALPKPHQDLLNTPSISYLNTLSTIDDAIDENADIADAILDLALATFELVEEDGGETRTQWHDTARPLDLNKAHSTIKQFWRDWSKEGFDAEVKPVLNLVIQDLSKYLVQNVKHARVLLPGAGLGRLLFELCLAGYVVEGNEISYHQLLASNFILNTTDRVNQYKLYPFVTGFNNHISRGNQLQYVTIPDVHPGTEIAQRTEAAAPLGEMNMTAGDFITSYSSNDNASTFDAVVTVYFVDTAPNVIRYMETIYHCLMDGGIWINIGPLLWHFEDSVVGKHDAQTGENEDTKDGDGKGNRASSPTGIAEPGSFELTNEEVLALAQSLGFEVLSHTQLPSSLGGYMQDPASMLQNRYSCSHWVLKKSKHV